MNPYHPAESVDLILSGDPFFETLERIIDEAREIIHIQTYIFEADATGKRVIAALKRATGRGVTVYVLADAYGSKALSNSFVKEICAQGIHFRLYSSFFSSESIYMIRRLHHKMVVVDKYVSLVGGINIADKYHGTANETAWLDYAVLVKGKVNVQLHALCDAIYKKKNAAIRQAQRELRKSGELGLRQAQPDNKTSFDKTTITTKLLVRFTRNDWVRGKNEIYRSYIHALNAAKREVVFVTSYFLPGYRFRKALKNASRRGVKITIVLAGKSDMPLLFYAEKYLYPFFLKNGINICEWKKSTMHAKTLVVDDHWTTIGSYNLNPLSRYRSIELNAEILNDPFATAFREHIDGMKGKDCKNITLEKDLKKLGFFGRLRNYIFYYFFKLFFSIFISRKVHKS